MNEIRVNRVVGNDRVLKVRFVNNEDTFEYHFDLEEHPDIERALNQLAIVAKDKVVELFREE